MPEVDMLKVKTIADNKGFNDLVSGADKAFSSLKGLAGQMAVVSAAAVAAGTALAALSLKTANAMDRIDKMSQKLNLSRQSFQELDYIAQRAGTSIEGLSTSMRTLTQKATENNKSFDQLGVSITDTNGKLKTQEQLFTEVITKLQALPPGVQRSKIAFDLLGRSAAELEPLLNAGAGSMEELRKRAHELGLVMNDQAVDAGVALVDAWTDLKAAASALLNNAMLPLLPYMQELAEYFTELAKEVAPLARKHIPYMIEALKKLWIEIRYGAVASKIAFQTLFNLMKEGWNNALIAMADALDNWLAPVYEKLSKLPSFLGGDYFKDGLEGLKSFTGELKKNAEAAKQAAQDNLDALQAEFAAIQNLREARIEALDALQAPADKAIKKQRDLTGAIIETEDATKKAEMTFKQFLGEAGKQLNNALQNIGSFMTQQWQAEIDQLQRQLEAQTRLIDAELEKQRAIRDKHAQVIEDLNWKQNQSITQSEYEALQTQKDAAQAAFDESVALEEELSNQKIELQRKTSVEQAKIQRKMAEMQKLTSAGNAIVQIAEGIAKAFAQGGALFGPALAAIVAAAGAVQLATIAKTPLPEIPSFSRGGEITGTPNREAYSFLPQPDNPHDDTLIWARNGEFILNKKQRAAYENLIDQNLQLNDMVSRERMIAAAGSNIYNNGNTENFSQTVNVVMPHGTPFWKQREEVRKARIAFARG